MRVKLNRELWRLIPISIRKRIVDGLLKRPYPLTMFEAYPSYQDVMSLACKDNVRLQDDLRQWLSENNNEIMRVFAESCAKAKANMVVSDHPVQVGPVFKKEPKE